MLFYAILPTAVVVVVGSGDVDDGVGGGGCRLGYLSFCFHNGAQFCCNGRRRSFFLYHHWRIITIILNSMNLPDCLGKNSSLLCIRKVQVGVRLSVCQCVCRQICVCVKITPFLMYRYKFLNFSWDVTNMLNETCWKMAFLCQIKLWKK